MLFSKKMDMKFNHIVIVKWKGLGKWFYCESNLRVNWSECVHACGNRYIEIHSLFQEIFFSTFAFSMKGFSIGNSLQWTGHVDFIGARTRGLFWVRRNFRIVFIKKINNNHKPLFSRPREEIEKTEKKLSRMMWTVPVLRIVAAHII